MAELYMLQQVVPNFLISWCNCFWNSQSRLGDICKIHSTRVWKKRNYSKYIVSPGLVETDQNAHFPAEIKQQYASLTAIGRTGKPQDVANVIAFFASDESEYMIGTYAPVDGGLVIGG